MPVGGVPRRLLSPGLNVSDFWSNVRFFKEVKDAKYFPEKQQQEKPGALRHKFYLEKASVFLLSGKFIRIIKLASLLILYLLFKSEEEGFLGYWSVIMTCDYQIFQALCQLSVPWKGHTTLPLALGGWNLVAEIRNPERVKLQNSRCATFHKKNSSSKCHISELSHRNWS